MEGEGVMKKRLVQNLALIALAIGALVAIHALSGTTEVQAARGGGNCPAVSNGLPGVKSEAGGEDSMSCHLDEGVVAEICIKAGNTNYNCSNCANTNACYTTSGIGTAWGTATRTGLQRHFEHRLLRRPGTDTSTRGLAHFLS